LVIVQSRDVAMSIQLLADSLSRFTRIPLFSAPTPLEKLTRLSTHLGRDIWVKRDDVTGFALGGNKVRKLEYLAAAALQAGADMLVTAGAIQSNHVRQTAAVAAKLGLGCTALLENPIGTTNSNYLSNGNRLLLDLFGARVEQVDTLDNADQQLAELAGRLRATGCKPYIIPIGGSNALGALGYVAAGLELVAQAAHQHVSFSAVVLASGSAGTHAGLALALANAWPDVPVIGVTVSRPRASQAPKVESLLAQTAQALGVGVPHGTAITLWDEFFAPRYGEPNQAGQAAIRLLAALEGLLLDPVYTGKAMAGLLAGVAAQRIPGRGPVLFLHTGGSPALFAYHPAAAD
jgi:D-cysteine desulfhydrase